MVSDEKKGKIEVDDKFIRKLFTNLNLEELKEMQIMRDGLVLMAIRKLLVDKKILKEEEINSIVKEIIQANEESAIRVMKDSKFEKLMKERFIGKKKPEYIG